MTAAESIVLGLAMALMAATVAFRRALPPRLEVGLMVLAVLTAALVVVHQALR